MINWCINGGHFKDALSSNCRIGKESVRLGIRGPMFNPHCWWIFSFDVVKPLMRVLSISSSFL